MRSEALSTGARLMVEGRVGIENEALGSIAGQSGLDEGERQNGEVRRRYEGSTQWMKAPNGQPTRLNERQWLQVRTENFKHWFGDWESAANRDYLRASTTARVTGAEIGVGFDKEPVSMPNMRRAAKKRARENLVGKYRNARSGLCLEVRPAGIDRAIGHGGAADKLRAFAAIPDVLRDGVVVFDGENPKHQRSRLVVVAGKVTIRGTEFYIGAGFREDANGRLFYDHELLEMERAERLSSQWGAAQLSKHPLPSAHLNDYTASFLGQAFAASKVTDANGEPQVVYHGTNADFDEFSPSGEFGTWLAERQGKASAYSSQNGGLILPLFAAIRNPGSWADVKTAREMVGPLANPGGVAHKERALERQSRVRSKLESMGLDGFHDGPVWSAFHPGQIKSATGNTGAFSAFDDSVLGNLASTDDLRTRATNAASDLLTSAESFNWLNRTINTQYHKATKDPEHFGRVFEMGQKFIETISRAASRPADLAPTLLPKLQNARAAVKGLFGGTKTNAALNGLAPAVFSDDLRDPKAHVWSDAELREKFNLTDEQIGLYREFRRAVDASLDEVAAAEAWKSLRRRLPNPSAARIPATARRSIKCRRRTCAGSCSPIT